MEGQRKAKRQIAHMKEKGGELILFVVGSYLTHSPSNVTYMQIVRLNNNGRSRISITCQHKFSLYNRG